MIYKSIRNKLIALGLSVITIMNIVSPVYTYAVNYSSQLGTNKALGSPLLNENFNYDDWNKWELIAFGVFASNFVTPLLDSYKTAFTVNTKGSAGKGKEALQFGSGSDSTANKALSSILDYVVKNQTSSTGKPITATYTEIVGDTSTPAESRQATINDLLIYSADDLVPDVAIEVGSRIVTDGPIIEDVTGAEVDGYDVYYLRKAKLCKLTVEGESGQPETVFDWQNGYDAQMMGAWVSHIMSSGYEKEISEILKKMINEKTPLFLDMFGNICGRVDGENIVIIPSASNCHIYNDGIKYNLLCSTILNSYTKASPKTLVNRLQAVSWNPLNGYEAGNPLSFKQEDINRGEVVVYFDTDQGIFDAVSKNIVKVIAGGANFSINWGSEITKLINSKIDNTLTSNSYSVRIEVLGGYDVVGDRPLLKSYTLISALENECVRAVEDIIRSANLLAHFYPSPSNKQTLATITTERGEADLFNSPVYVSVNLPSDNDAYKVVIRNVVNSSFKYLDGSDASSSSVIDLPSASSLKADLMKKADNKEVANWLFYDGDNISKFAKNAILGGAKEYFNLPQDIQQIMQNSMKWNELGKKDVKLKNKVGIWKFAKNDPKYIVEDKTMAYGNFGGTSYTDSVQRVLKVYPQNETMKNAMNVLGVKEGTEFALWTPRIYLTYLKWFGVIDGENKFNESLFDISSDALNKNAEELFSGTFLTKEEKEAEVLDYTYIMLHPTEGREYRASIIMNWFSDWIYRSYQNMVYGSSLSSYDDTRGTTVLNSSGFLRIDNYQDNFVTAWFMGSYSKYAIAIIGIMLILIVIVGVINQKNFSWFLVSLIIMVNVIIITPSTGEITPYVVNNVVQSIFKDNMTYWSMSESIQNAKVEKETSTSTSTNDGLTVNDYIRMLNINYLDRAIMLKTDISKKVTEDTTGILNQIQQLNSTRWLLPTIMRQFTASDSSKNYVYQSLGDTYDNWSNMYWVYNPEDKLSVTTSNAYTVEDIDPSLVPSISVASKSGRYTGYTPVTADVIINNSISNQQQNSNTPPSYLTYPWQSTSRLKADEDVFHAGFYLIPDLTISDANWEWDTYAETLPTDANAFREKAIDMEQEASTYSPTKVGAKPNMGFLWTTENAGLYFYGVVKDTFGSSKTLASLTADLQGYYKSSSVTGEDERQSFMHYQDTGYIRDFLDMEELFKNVIPYMYSVQLLAGGTDGTNGVLGDTKMTNYELYSDNYKSWLFRSNWITKLVEDKDLNRPTKIGLSGGKKVTVEEPLNPKSYTEAGREMVFSEAQMKMSNLKETDLSLVELKILEVNKAVERKWTLLLNYVNTPNITTEVIYRQMATDALLEFNREFSPDRLMNGAKALYPNSLDLRSISFDSVMKMLMLNSTRDSSYIYGDTMKKVIENSDIISAIFLLVSAFLCCFLIPLIRNIVMGLILFAGIWSMVMNILASGITKLKISTAFLLNNIIFMVLTLLYYSVFALLISSNTADSVLSVSNITVDAGPPTWQFLIIVIISIVYIVLSYKLLQFTLKNVRDMGFEVLTAYGSMLVGKVTNGMSNISSKIGIKRNTKNENSNSFNSSKNYNNTYNNTDNSSKDKDKKKKETDRYNASGYNSYREKDSSSRGKKKDNYFDKEAEKGSKMKK